MSNQVLLYFFDFSCSFLFFFWGCFLFQNWFWKWVSTEKKKLQLKSKMYESTQLDIDLRYPMQALYFYNRLCFVISQSFEIRSIAYKFCYQMYYSHSHTIAPTTYFSIGRHLFHNSRFVLSNVINASIL